MCIAEGGQADVVKQNIDCCHLIVVICCLVRDVAGEVSPGGAWSLTQWMCEGRGGLRLGVLTIRS